MPLPFLIVWNGSHAVDAGNMQVGNMMAFMQYAMQIIMAFLMITMMSIMIPRANVAAKRINEIMETEVSIKDEENPVQPKEEQKGEVVFEHVGFAYPGADGNSLTDISFLQKRRNGCVYRKYRKRQEHAGKSYSEIFRCDRRKNFGRRCGYPTDAFA